MTQALPKPKYPAARIGMPGEQAYTASEVRALLADRDRLAAALQASPVAPASEGEDLIADCYAIPGKRGQAEVKIQRARQIEGPDLWKVSFGGDCLNKDGQWEWEPMPSSRDDDFLARCRFASAAAAIDAARTASLGRVG